MKALAAVDFETYPIGDWPDSSPRPVGVAIAPVGERPQYWRWGHPSGGNNCDQAQAKARLKDAYHTFACIFHNAMFDLAVGKTHLGLSYPDEFHDTLILTFLHDPRAQHLGLKETCEALLGVAPTEREELRAWLQQHIPGARPSDVYRAPGNIVAPYAIGDGTRTIKLFKFLWPKIQADGMDEAYRRELRLIPVLIKMTHAGMPVARRRLEADLRRWGCEQEQRDKQIRRILKTPNLNIDSNQDLAVALERAGKVKQFILTAKGNPSVARAALEATLPDEKLLKLLTVRGIMATYMGTFARPWLGQSEHDDHLHPIWNATRRSEKNQTFGARTGRFSSKPNLQNVPKPRDLDEGLPNMRDYLIPEAGHVIGDLDYQQQELRIFAHFEDANALQKYNADPRIDFHEMTREGVSIIVGRDIPRKLTKSLVFGLVYGQGLKRTAEVMGTDIEEARRIRNALYTYLPGLRALKNEVERMGSRGEEIRTWGGRLYKVEDSCVITGK